MWPVDSVLSKTIIKEHMRMSRFDIQNVDFDFVFLLINIISKKKNIFVDSTSDVLMMSQSYVLLLRVL